MANFIDLGNAVLNLDQVVMARRWDDGHVTVDTTATHGDAAATPGRFVFPAGPSADAVWKRLGPHGKTARKRVGGTSPSGNYRAEKTKKSTRGVPYYS